MNHAVLYVLAEIAMTLAGFSGIAAAFRLRGTNAWSSTELRVLWFLIIDSFLVVLLALLPVVLSLSGLSDRVIWTICSLLLGGWFGFGNFLAFQGERRKSVIKQLVKLPAMRALFRGVMIIALIMAACLFLSALNLLIPRGQAMYVGGLLTLLAIAAVEFLFFIGRASAAKPNSD